MLRAIFFSFYLLCFSAVSAQPLNVKVSAQSAILMNVETGKVLYKKNEDQVAYPASLTKIATCLFALKQVRDGKEKIVPCPAHCLQKMNKSIKEYHQYKDPAYLLEPDGTHFWIRSGEELLFTDLLHGMMLMSGNDAANYVAYYASGSIPKFMKGMNAYLKELGCKNTQFYNPHGLHYPHHVTTAYDMALIAREAIKNNEIKNIVSKVEYIRSPTNLQNARTIYQSNALLKAGKFFYPKAVGLKTGYTSNAGYTFAGVAEDSKRSLIAILMGCKDSSERYREAIRLFEAAFSEVKQERLLFRSEENSFKRTLKEAKTPLKAILYDDVKISYYPSEEPQIQIQLNWENITLPIEKGSWVGEIHILDEKNNVIEIGPLYASETVKKTFLAWIRSLLIGEGVLPFIFQGSYIALFILVGGCILCLFFQRARKL